MEICRRDALKLLGFTACVGAIAPKTLTTEKRAMHYRLGKTPARPDAVKVRLRDYYVPDKLPPLPTGDFGHQGLVPDWQMLGNDTVGDCAIAGPFHAEMLWNKEAGRDINVTTDCTLRAYSAITQYDPNAYNPITQQNPTDKGSDVIEVAEYWRTTGLTDASGVVHKIDAYAALEPGNVEELWHAMYLFDGVGIGIEIPKEWMQASARGSTWERVPTPHIEGGHYILGVGRVSGYIDVITWGQQQLMSPAGYEQFNDESFIYLTEEKLVNGKDIDGFDLPTLIADFKDIANGG